VGTGARSPYLGILELIALFSAKSGRIATRVFSLLMRIGLFPGGFGLFWIWFISS
jgi:hypothetical protein